MSQIVRSVAPKVDQEKCIGCGNCETYCPEGTVMLTGEKKVIFDYRYCKGCGVCANECPVKAIAMVKEGEQ
jgi:pyruvate ferredoxin oxidoreductase delta subunit